MSPSWSARGDDDPDVDQPGLSDLRSAAADLAREALPRREGLGREAAAGLTTAVGSVPDGMANALLAGVNPIYGLYANMVAPIAGGALSSSRMMVINSTSASALIAGQALVSTPQDQRAEALFLLVLIAGALQVAFGLLRLGRLTRFISFSVMTGFVAGIGIVLMLSQLPTVTGYDAGDGNAMQRAFEVLGHLGDVEPASVAVAGSTLVLGLLLRRTRLASTGTLVALVVPSVVVAVAGIEGVAVIGDIGAIAAGFPVPSLPSPSALSAGVVTGAVSVAIVGLVQGAGVSQSVSDPGGARSSMSRDFIAQGAGNVASGLFRGLPVGGSLKGTVLNVSSGGRGRRAVVLSGIWMIAIVVVLSGLVTEVAMPALGALLILISSSSIKPDDITAVWRAGWPARLAAATTFACALLLPIQVAVAAGVLLAALLHVTSASTDVSLVELVERPDGRVEERRAPQRLPSRAITVLDVYGSLFYAAARTLERRLPRPDGPRPVLVLRLRGRPALGATAVDVLASYAERLQAVGGRLYLVGLSEGARAEMMRDERFRPAAGIEIYEATPVRGESTRQARAAAEGWLLAHPDPEPDAGRADGRRHDGDDGDPGGDVGAP